MLISEIGEELLCREVDEGNKTDGHDEDDVIVVSGCCPNLVMIKARH